MAAGDMRMRLTHINIAPQVNVSLEIRYGIEDKRGDVDSRGDGFAMSWDEFWSLLSASERSALNSIKDKMLNHVKSLDVTKFGASLDL